MSKKKGIAPDAIGIFFDLSYEEYEALDGLRKTHLWIMNEQTPAHYRHALGHPEVFEKEHYLVGKAAHIAVLEPDRFEGTFARRPGTYTNSKGETKPWHSSATACKEVMAEFAEQGKAVLKEEEYERCLRMRDVLVVNSQAKDLLNGGKMEVTLQWRDKKTGLLLKARIDLLREDAKIVTDYKTTKCAAPAPFGWDAYKYGYHFQVAMYHDGYEILTGSAADESMGQPILIAQEKEAPYCMAMYQVEKYELELGQIQYQQVLAKVKECVEKEVWPGYGQGLHSLVLPAKAGLELEA